MGVFCFVPYAMFCCVKDTRFISLGMGVVGLRAASLCTNWQEPALVGSSNHNPFAAILSHAWQAWSISSDQRFRKTGPEKEPSGEQNIEPWNGMSGNRLTFTGSCSTGILARVDSCSFMHVFFNLAENRLTQRCRENQSSRTFSSPVTKGHLPHPSEARPCPLAIAEMLVYVAFLRRINVSRYI